MGHAVKPGWSVRTSWAIILAGRHVSLIYTTPRLSLRAGLRDCPATRNLRIGPVLILVVHGPAFLATVYHHPTWRNVHG